jgi:hypothetical protein
MKLTTAIRRLAGARSPARGEGSSFERLAAYHERRLDEAEAEEVRDELALRPESAEVVADLERLDARPTREARAAIPRQEMSEAFDALRERLAEAGSLPASTSGVPLWPWWRRPWALATVMALVPALLLSIWVVRLERQLAARSAPTTAATIVQLSAADEQAVRSIPRPATDDSVEDRLGGHRWAELVVFVIGTDSLDEAAEYSVEIRKAGAGDGTSIWRQDNVRRDPTGSFQLVVPRGFLEPGEYRLIVIGHGPGEPRSLAEHEVRFE